MLQLKLKPSSVGKYTLIAEHDDGIHFPPRRNDDINFSQYWTNYITTTGGVSDLAYNLDHPKKDCKSQFKIQGLPPAPPFRL